MGMDVYGRNPKSEKGEYFRNNIWWWHPLWDYCLDNHPDPAAKVENGHSNDGDGLDAFDSYKLGILLRQDCISGLAKNYEIKYLEYVNNLPKEDCTYCKKTGFLTFSKKIEGSDQIVTEQIQCSNCSGTGIAEHYIKNYPFSVKNVEEFSEFCINSGGFNIC